ncbi:MAG: RNA polymerase sigma-70 factor [Candidatus Pedobacter colombiensis]|uniref:RNA polymerase sigma-70 factor n=1 Tax=Candidatus Pedobacter colombiensis TaxID=3121371 RepID=A0AAJ5W528_9SPHI|nr:RNA polymerase sigma-70 factor [Pedobacter sp.]WEK18683.1 MAG: RNA polymerase sigma-70 factor [Pedobacter sp.]
MENYSSYSDEELTVLLKSDNKIAFTELYNRHWKRLFGIAYNRLKNIQAAEDIVHDVMVSFWNNREKVEISNLSAYLATATKYMILQKIRKEQRRLTYSQSMESSDETDNINLEDSLHFKNIMQLIQEEINQLPEKCKIIFKYSREEHLSIKEIAGKLNLSTSTVENQLNKALGRLRIVMKNIHLLLFFTFL